MVHLKIFDGHPTPFSKCNLHCHTVGDRAEAPQLVTSGDEVVVRSAHRIPWNKIEHEVPEGHEGIKRDGAMVHHKGTYFLFQVRGLGRLCCEDHREALRKSTCRMFVSRFRHLEHLNDGRPLTAANVICLGAYCGQ